MKASRLEDVLPLSPLQEGLLFHALSDEQGTDVYHTQLVMELEGLLDVERLRSAARALLRRHANLRAGFRQRKNGQPIQVILGQVPLPWADVDLTPLPPEERQQALETLLEEDRERRFVLSAAPVVRFTLVRLEERRHKLVLTSHHILIDGWSAPILQRELLTLYASHGDPSGLPAVTPYRTYLEWLARQDADAAKEAWRHALAELAGPTLVAAPDPQRALMLPEYHTTTLSEELTAALTGRARAHGLTVNTLLQGVWALVLAELTGRDDVVFGSVVSGRPPEIPGIETMVGLFINTVPVRVRLDPRASLADNLARLQGEQSLLLDHQHLRLGELQRLVGASDLFDTALTVENYPGGGTAGTGADGLHVTGVSGKDAAHYPLRLIAGLLGSRLQVRLEYRPDLYRPQAAQALVAWIEALLRAATDDAGRMLAHLPRPTDEQRAAFPETVRAHEHKAAHETGADDADCGEVALATRTADTPLTPSEEILCGLFGALLGHDKVGVEDDFFALGGHSLSAIKLLSRVRTAFDVELPIRTLFEAPTVAALARRIGQAGQARPALTPGERPERVPLSFAQQRLWFMHRLEGPSATYNIPMPLRLTGPLDRAALAAALSDLTARHESLRTVFPEADGVPYQHILDPEQARPQFESVESCNGTSARQLLDASRYAFDLTQEIPLRATLLRISEREHILLLLVHHIAGDGGSVAPLLRDLAEAYTARHADSAPAWTPLPVQYADYTLWQRQLLGSEDDQESLLAEQLAFWRKTLSGAPEQLVLPADRLRPAVPDHRGGTVEFALDAVTHQHLAELAKAADCTLFMVVQAGLATLLTRLGAGQDIPLGTAVAGRTDQALEDLAGFFVNTLVLRTDTSNDPTFRDLLRRVRETDLAAYAHQDVPFERLVEAVNPVRTAASHPLFQVMLTFQNNARPRLELPDVTVGFEGFGVGVAKFDLSFSIAETNGPDGRPAGLRGVIEYAEELFDPGTVRTLAERFARLLASAAVEPARPLSRLDLLSDAERRAVSDAWQGPPGSEAPATLPELFRRQVDRTPHAPAVEAADATLTYAELDARANRLAHHLIARGAGPERLVALALPRSAALVTAVLAVSKAGAAYLPLDPDYPRRRLDLTLADAAPDCVLTTAEFAGRLSAGEAAVVLLDDPATAAALEDGDGIAPAPALLPDHPAYVIYTSGSTGTPKGVVVPHSGLAGLAANHRSVHGAGEGSRVLQFVSPGFDVSVSELCMALLTGGCLVVADQVPVGGELAAFLAERRITHAHIPPAVLDSVPAAALPDLGTLITGGEACTPQLIDRWATGRRMVNGYGPTEMTVEVTCAVNDPEEDGPASIGRPHRDVRVHVLDDRLQPVPPGVPGELYLSGPGIARGYLHRPGATAASFVADPFGGPGSRMYRSGDLGRWREDGRLDFLGRVDDQVKLRGFRIEPGEIEAVLGRRAGVARAAVTVREDRPGDRRLVAYVMPEDPDGADLDAARLRADLAEELPAYMVPSAVVLLDALPLTPNGKLDHRALPAPEAGRGGGQGPRSAHEEVLCRLFAEVLGAERVGIDDNFFESGGHSLLASQLAGRIGRALGVEVPLRAVFEAPTPAMLLRRLYGDGDHTDGFGELLPLRTTGERRPLFCVHPVGGLGWCYSTLLPTLDADQPLYGLQNKGLAGGEPLTASFAELLTGYAEQIRSVQPTGPYRLLGYSMGGVLAHALAVALEQQGESVELLVLLDSYPVEPGMKGELTKEQVLTDMFQAYARIHGDPDQVPADPAETRARVVDYMGRGASESRYFDDEQRGTVLDVLINNVTLVHPTELGVFTEDVLLVAATENVRPWADPQAWQPFTAGGFERYEIAATHEGLLAPEPAAEIGRILSKRL
ncbi:amino acid adenylation domain-containing protein [Streptomyces sp. NBC_01525]|uniref:amino acid adenylation domain-containing protein n=1 Tax=Streptomyces sp. NBC_01525 TaxID=2903893 RepID=UPI00386CC99E